MSEESNLPVTKSDRKALESRLTEAMWDMQTEVLGAFYGFSQTIQDRFKGQDVPNRP